MDILSYIMGVKSAETSGGGGGSSDLSTAEVTVVDDGVDAAFYGVYIDQIDELTTSAVVKGPGATLFAVLYKGVMYGNIDTFGTVTVSGDCEYDYDYGDIIITGDCTITIS